jgi:hypothetical protein
VNYPWLGVRCTRYVHVGVAGQDAPAKSSVVASAESMLKALYTDGNKATPARIAPAVRAGTNTSILLLENSLVVLRVLSRYSETSGLGRFLRRLIDCI